MKVLVLLIVLGTLFYLTSTQDYSTMMSSEYKSSKVYGLIKRWTDYVLEKLEDKDEIKDADDYYISKINKAEKYKTKYYTYYKFEVVVKYKCYCIKIWFTVKYNNYKGSSSLSYYDYDKYNCCYRHLEQSPEN
jgi:hypothetical protein